MNLIESIFKKWLQHYICEATSSTLELPQPERLVVFDISSSQKTKKILK